MPLKIVKKISRMNLRHSIVFSYVRTTEFGPSDSLGQSATTHLRAKPGSPDNLHGWSALQRRVHRFETGLVDCGDVLNSRCDPGP